MEIPVLIAFCVVLIICLLLKISLLYALLAGFVLFFIYALLKGFSFRNVIKMCIDGIKTAKNVLITFLLIGVLTAMWRAAGTIPTIICYCSSLFVPSVFVTVSFLACCLVSFLTGTAFGTAATMGVICSAMSSAMGISPMLTGGAILAGSYFGDRCSPLSTSALLVSELTGTDIFKNIKGMLKTAFFPFLISCAVYTIIGCFMKNSGSSPDLYALFLQEFSICRWALIPAVVILVLSLLRVRVKLAMLASIAVSIPVAIFSQKAGPIDLIRCALFGYTANSPELSSMISGGGVRSMLNVAAIVCLSCAYSGIFECTGLLNLLKSKIKSASEHITPFGATLLTAVLTGIVACNQTLTIMLTEQLCLGIEDNKDKFALEIENSAVIVPPLIPWSIACAVSLSTIGAPTKSVIAAFYLYLLPLWQLGISLIKKAHKGHKRRTHAVT